MLNALTIDIEDYYQVSNFEHLVKKEDWDKYESRVVANTRKILEILDEAHTKATFFVLGWTAERFPQLVKDIDGEGHEIASHGYSHKLIYKMSKEEFKNDLMKSTKILENITNKKIIGFRAASCSITKDSLWAFSIMKDVGMEYDASIFPIHHDRYGISTAERFLNKWNGDGIIEFPFSTIQIFGQNAPVAGGGYFRLYPYWFTKWAIKRINKEGYPAMVYIHPWELDPAQPRIKASAIANFRHYVNLSKTETRLKRLLNDFKFVPIRSCL